ncbi:hypothetical protein [uncultured Chryseobacterium sp.]|uniref:hypothetical protein n=1 Tax=uncultured Chryseobacterium sp. TaxID=259322 RepID=UPI0025DB0DB6|nr:hypothetical protein [uncultured Chryseobacterium sp.]
MLGFSGCVVENVGYLRFKDLRILKFKDSMTFISYYIWDGNEMILILDLKGLDVLNKTSENSVITGQMA